MRGTLQDACRMITCAFIASHRLRNRNGDILCRSWLALIDGFVLASNCLVKDRAEAAGSIVFLFCTPDNVSHFSARWPRCQCTRLECVGSQVPIPPTESYSDVRIDCLFASLPDAWSVEVWLPQCRRTVAGRVSHFDLKILSHCDSSSKL